MAINSENPSGIYVDMTPPSLTYPNGGELITTTYIPVRWVEPSFVESSNFVFWYEIYVTDAYKEKREPNWVQIARVPSGTSSYDWTINKRIIGDDCRIGIRTVDHQGFRSEMCVSADSFGIGGKILPPPAVFEPSSGSTYFDYITIALDSKGILGSYSQRSYYRLSYTCNSLGIGQTVIADNIPVSSSVVYWDIRRFASASDYVLRAEFIEGNYVSIPTIVDNIIINSLNYFITDTTAPVGYVSIENNSEYTKDRDVVLNLKAYDKTTGVKSVRVEQLNISDSGNSTTLGSYQSMTNLLSWSIRGEDGVKLIQTRFKDYAGNILTQYDSADHFRTYKNFENNEVTTFTSVENESGDDDVWIAFGGTSPSIYKNTRFKTLLDNEATSMIYDDTNLYIATKTTDNKCIFQRYNETDLTTIEEFDAVDSVVNSMEKFDGKIFMGMQNGDLISYSNSSFTTEYQDYDNLESINYIVRSGNILFVFFNNSEDAIALVDTGASSYTFVDVDLRT